MASFVEVYRAKKPGVIRELTYHQGDHMASPEERRAAILHAQALLNTKVAGIDDGDAWDMDAIRAHVAKLRESLDTFQAEAHQGAADADTTREVNGILSSQITTLSATVDDQRKTIEDLRARCNEATSRAAVAEDQKTAAMTNAAKMEGYINRIRETDGIDIERRHRAIHGRRERDGDTSRRG